MNNMLTDAGNEANKLMKNHLLQCENDYYTAKYQYVPIVRAIKNAHNTHPLLI